MRGNTQPYHVDQLVSQELTALQSRLEAVVTEKDTLESNLKEVSDDKAKLQAEKKDLVAQLDALQDKIKSATSEVSGTDARLSELQAIMDANEKVCIFCGCCAVVHLTNGQNASASLQEAQKKVNTLENELDLITSKLMEAQTQIDGSKAEKTKVGDVLLIELLSIPMDKSVGGGGRSRSSPGGCHPR